MLHSTEPFMVTPSSSQYDLNIVDGDINTKSSSYQSMFEKFDSFQHKKQKNKQHTSCNVRKRTLRHMHLGKIQISL